MKVPLLLIIDGIINLVLGILLLLAIPFSSEITRFLGVPVITEAFYPSIMGAVFVGIAIALFIEAKREDRHGLTGLGLGGAVAINLCGGIVLMGWLVFGSLHLPLRGAIFLWVLALTLVAISMLELLGHARLTKPGKPR